MEEGLGSARHAARLHRWLETHERVEALDRFVRHTEVGMGNRWPEPISRKQPGPAEAPREASLPSSSSGVLSDDGEAYQRRRQQRDARAGEQVPPSKSRRKGQSRYFEQEVARLTGGGGWTCPNLIPDPVDPSRRDILIQLCCDMRPRPLNFSWVLRRRVACGLENLVRQDRCSSCGFRQGA